MNRRSLLGAIGASKVCLDSNVLLYFLSGDVTRGALVQEVLQLARQGVLELVVSGIVKMELLVGAMRQGRLVDVRRVVGLTDRTRGLVTMPITDETLSIGAEIRARTNLKVPDALVVATAATEGCGAILGNDRDMGRIREMDDVGSIVSVNAYALPRFVRLDDLVQQMS